MASRGDKVEERVHSIVAEARVPLDTRLFSENIIILPLDIAGDFTKAGAVSAYDLRFTPKKSGTYVNSLSILSPKPGVSTIVREMRTPSSSSSGGGQRRSEGGSFASRKDGY